MLPSSASSETREHALLAHATDSLAALVREVSLAAPAKPFGSRFTVGQIFAGRYRIVGALGRGGMGEVYRADDLTLGVPVALKFLTEIMAENPLRLARFRKEIAAARQVSHPNVCRVYDITESDGHVFLSMEFITGDTLAAALARARQLHPSLVIDLGRQIALGLQAVHEEGLVHRDLKPANVMLDSRGRPKLTDFGLAANVGAITGADACAGTPAYQAPEQLAGKHVTVQTDIYAFGVLLYELLTGRRPFEAVTREELLEIQRTEQPDPPSDWTPGVPPEVSHIVLRCLAADPADRPTSAHEIWRALPGNDALLAAVAAGETPSADLVANAGGEGTLRPAVAFGLFVTFLVFLVAAIGMKERTSVLRVTPLSLPPRELQARAETILQSVGHQAPVVECSGKFVQHYDFEEWSLLHDRTPLRWSAMTEGRAGVTFEYERASEPLPGLPARGVDRRAVSVEPGWATVDLDPSGRLVRMIRAPWPGTEPARSDGPASLHDLFVAAGLQPTEFAPTAPDNHWDPVVPTDRRSAWTGSYPGRSEWPLRVEAGTFRGAPVYFRCISPWVVPPSKEAWNAANKVSPFASWALEVILLLVGGVFAVWNLRRERVDRRGTAVMVSGVTVASFFGLALSMNHTANYRVELDRLSHVLGIALWTGTQLGVAYLALDPYVRRHWPWQLVGWARLLAGRWRDPRVGADVLIGVTGGALFAAWYLMLLELPGWLGLPKNPRYGMAFATAPFSDAPYLMGHAIARATLVFFAAFLLNRVFRKPWLGFVATVVVATAFLANYSTDSPWIYYAGCGALGVLGIFLLLRFGLLTGIVVMFTHYFICRSLITWDLTTWHWWGTLLHLGTLLALAGYGLIGAIGRWHRQGAAGLAHR